MTTPFYITTPIYYVNDVPHLGHAYTTTVADAIARFHRMRGDDTRFLTGTDEHGQKVEEAATKRGLTPQQLVDQVGPRFDECWKAIGIEGYRFIRTTDAKHKRVVANLWHRIRRENPDDIYLATYQGWYCVGCEAFYTESQLIKDGDSWNCAVHKRPVSWIDKERSWFFRLSRYAQPLLDHIAANPDFIRPQQYKNEIVSFLEKEGLRDLSISRTSFAWGVPTPEPDPEGLSHVIYVWMDALTNYYSDLCTDDGALDSPDAAKYFPHAIHLIGKDILRFHAVYWPAFLMAAKLPLPKTILAHGWWTVRGEKISKSLPATRIDPVTLSTALAVGPLGRPIGIDAMRYYLLREVPLGNDGDFTFESLFGRFNADLANDLGNLANRSLTLIRKLAADAPPAEDTALFAAGENPHWQLEVQAFQATNLVAKELDACAPSRALEHLWKFIGVANRYIDQTQPWAMAKAKDPALPHTLWCLQRALWTIAQMIAPVLPATSETLLGWLGDAHPAMWPEGVNGRVFPLAPETLATDVEPTVLFPRLDDAAQEKILKAVVGDAAVAPEAQKAEKKAEKKADKKPDKKADKKADAAAPEEPAGNGVIAYEDFAKLDLRVGKVVAAQPIPKKDRVLHLTVDLGEAAPRTIVAGIASAYKPEQLVGKQVIVVANLAPRKMGELMSQGMILAAGDEAILGLSAVDADVPPGTKVR